MHTSTSRRRPRRFTTPHTSTTRAASASSRACPAALPARSSSARSSWGENLFHRGAQGADPETGDGSGILLQVPDAFLRAAVDFELPAPARYGVAMCFLPQDDADARRLERLLERTVEGEGQRVLGWRDVPIRSDACGELGAGGHAAHPPAVRRRLGRAGRRPGRLRAQAVRDPPGDAAKAAGDDMYLASCSSRTIVYKGMLTSLQLPDFYPDLRDESLSSRVALVHSRFSTNTFPSWPLAHPYRLIAHNGEINTLMGNVNWIRARESDMRSELFGDDLRKVMPVVRPGSSDSATFDNVLELLTLAGRSLPHALMMMMPEAWENKDDLPPKLRGFYAYHSCVMEPWDGPAAIAFSDGRVVGATLDRNGLRPGRWMETRDGYVVMASETGVLPVDEETVVRKGRLHPGRLLLVDLEAGRVVSDDELKRRGRRAQPYGEWVARCSVHFDDLPEPDRIRGASSRGASVSSPSATPRRTSGCCWRRWRPPARSQPDRWATTSRWPSSPIASRRCSPTSSSCSRRSPTRPSTRSAKPWS